MTNYLSIDIGGTQIKYAQMNHSGNIMEKGHVQTPQNQVDFLVTIDQIVKRYPQVQGLAFCAPGKIEETTIRFGGAIPFIDGIDFANIYANLEIPIAVLNDGKAGVLAESWLGSLRDEPNCAAIILGTGVGGGIIVNGQLVQGTHFQAGELSFMNLNVTTTDFSGYSGALLSAVSMISRINQSVGNVDDQDGYAAFKALEENHEEAQAIFAAYCRYVAVLIMNVQAVVDLKRYAIGGGISSQPRTLEGIKQAYDAIYEEVSLVRTTLTKPEIVEAKFHNDANLYGALYHLLIEIDKKRN